MASMILLILTFLLLHRLMAIIFIKFLSPAAPPPPPPSYGPKSHPLIGCLLSYCRNRRRLLQWYTDMLAASPSNTITLSRLGARRTIVTANPSVVEHILSTNFANYPKGKPFTDILGDLLGRGIFNSDGHLWLSQRRAASRAFTLRSLRHLIDHILVSETNGHLLPTLAANGRAVVDLQDFLRGFSFRVICRMFLGASTTDPQLGGALDVASAISASRGSAPVALLWKAKRALRLGSERRLRAAVDLIHSSVMEIIRAKRKGEVNNEDLVAYVMGKGGDEEDEEDIRDMVISFMMAGRDTTSSALTWFFWLVSTHPEVEENILNEMEKKMKMMGSVEGMWYESLKEMKYLEATLMETMRLYPPVAWDSKHAAGDDVLPDGTIVRKGDRVTYFPYGMGRMEEIWGKDWEEFRPERWVAEGGREVLKVSPFVFPVFQAGPRVCLGREMAMAKMKFVAAAVLRRFELRWAGREAPVMLPFLTAHMAGGLPVEVVERQPH